MTTTQRVTITLPEELLARARSMSNGNLSQFISRIVDDYLEQERRRELREALIAGYLAYAEEDLETANAFRYAEEEADARYVPPYIEDESAMVVDSSARPA